MDKNVFSFKQLFLIVFTFTLTIATLVMKLVGKTVLIDYYLYLLFLHVYHIALCYIINNRLNDVINKLDADALTGVRRFLGHMEMLTALIVVNVVTEGIVQLPIALYRIGEDPARGLSMILFIPWLLESFIGNVTYAGEMYYAWYLPYCIAMLFISMHIIGKYHKARKIIAAMELDELISKNAPWRKEIREKERLLAETGLSDTEKSAVDPALLAKIPQEELVPDEEELQYILQQRKRPDNPDEAEQDWTCQACGSDNPAKAEECVFCGAKREKGEN